MKILHLVGSPTSEYYYGVSMMYVPGCVASLKDEKHLFLMAHLDGTWSLQETLESLTPSVSLAEAMSAIAIHKPDICQPHMFCYTGMVTCREIATLLDIPLLGSPGNVMALTTDKFQTRAIVNAIGVKVPEGQLLQSGETIKMDPPFILKPCREDNSMGITLVTKREEIEDAVNTAFEFDDMALCEKFIPLGRELRIGVFEKEDGTLEMLPACEYLLAHKEKPIRTSADKISTDHGKLDFAPVERICPASMSEELKQKCFRMAATAHKALGCKHYSIYDVRVDPNDEPYFIECSCYCSFSPKSALIVLSLGNPEYDETTLFYKLAKKAITEHKPAFLKGENKQFLGMRRS